MFDPVEPEQQTTSMSWLSRSRMPGDRIVNTDKGDAKERELNRVFIMGSITAGMESGFLLPKVRLAISWASSRLIWLSTNTCFEFQAGEDVEWLKLNYPKFEELARQGDSDFVDLVEELQSRRDLDARTH